MYRTCLVYLFKIITVCCNAGQDYDWDVFCVHPEDIMKETITIFFSKKTTLRMLRKISAFSWCDRICVSVDLMVLVFLSFYRRTEANFVDLEKKRIQDGGLASEKGRR